MNLNNIGDHLAVLIDGDNVSSKFIAGLMAEVANYGTASVRRVYGDWTSPQMKGWRECLLEHSIVPIQQFAYTGSKNATDGAMIIDAMDLLYTGRFSSFCLVTSDSDFTRLAARIREQGISVYGFGNRHNTHRAFIAACNKFVYLDAMTVQADEKDEIPSSTPQGDARRALTNDTTESSRLASSLKSPQKAPGIPLEYQNPPEPDSNQLPARIEPTRRPLDRAALDGLKRAITSSNIYDDENFVNLAEVGTLLVKLSPDLNARNYGYGRLRDFVVASGLVELKKKTMDDGPPIALVKLKD
ncbi:hypothetical protein WHR41_01432 [Cladosporium halotolerans]|uniref:HTH OST-type domain-containing protein n=1 Tax=Cladosporium halotolerans TaxID=1052096 RepID=A0AB34L498_9PEZI